MKTYTTTSRRYRGLLAIAGFGFTALLAAACAGVPQGGTQSSAASPAAAQAAGNTADIRQFQFQPNPLTVKAGTAITWTNRDGTEHSVTQGSGAPAQGGFDSNLLSEGKTFSHTFSQAGDFPYFCKRHPSMQGTVKVTS